MHCGFGVYTTVYSIAFHQVVYSRLSLLSWGHQQDKNSSAHSGGVVVTPASEGKWHGTVMNVLVDKHS